MRTIKHPLSGSLYDLMDDGTVRVDKHGEVGYFTAQGTWLHGAIRHADPQLCLWIGGTQLPNRFQQAAAAVTQGPEP